MASLQSSGPSFEDPHNSVHVTAACGYDFSQIGYAAFEPLLLVTSSRDLGSCSDTCNSMLHHCNIDRLYAMWQAIYPGIAVASFNGTSPGQLGTPAGSAINPDSPLKPFVRAGGGYHTSLSVTYAWDLGYTYPGLTPWTSTPDELSTATMKTVRSLYGPPEGFTRVRRMEAPKQYFVQLAADRSRLPLPCIVKIKMGDVVAGSLALLAAPTAGISHTEFSLKAAMSNSRIKALTLDATGEFFKGQLTVHVVDVSLTYES